MRTVLSRCASARQVVGAAVGLLLASALVSAQVRVKGDVLLINVIATVVDGKGRTVPNLTSDDFILEEDGQPQTIQHLLPSADLPISLGQAVVAEFRPAGVHLFDRESSERIVA